MKKKIALVTGGYSGEATISYKSAITVNNNIDRKKFDVFLIDITLKEWFYTSEKGEKCLIQKQDFTLLIDGGKIVFDAVLMCLHGTPGEDGKLQSYFDLLGLPYTSCDATTSALTFNKRFTLAVAAFSDIKVAKSLHLFKKNKYSVNDILNSLSVPVFVKPNNGGSSLGMSKVTINENLDEAILKAFEVDDQVLVEELIEGREFTVGVFRTNNEIKVLPITEIITHNEFFDYEAKYLGKSDEITPAIINVEMKFNLENTAAKVYEILNCSGIVRIDFIYCNKKNLPILLEVNTVPGQSEASIVPQQVIAMGWTLEQFYTSLIEECLINKN